MELANGEMMVLHKMFVGHNPQFTLSLLRVFHPALCRWPSGWRHFICRGIVALALECELYPGGESLKLSAMFFVAGVMGGDFGPEGVGMVEVVQMGEFVDDDIVAERLGDVHEADVEGDGAVG